MKKLRAEGIVAFVILATLSAASYVGISALGGQSGFPLDDAWIHQTYARNLAESGQMAFVPGQISAGSTSPLWTLLIAAGYKLNIDFRLWTFALGVISLAASAWFLRRLSLRLWPHRPKVALAAGLLCIFEWHFVWASASGMETVLFAALGLALIEQSAHFESNLRHALTLGVLSGLFTLTRPEGLLLIGLVGLTWLTRPAITSRLRFLMVTGASFVLLLLPFILANIQASGTAFPNTFYAKQQEYGVYFSTFEIWLPRALDVLGAPFIGAQILLVPGLLFGAYFAFRRLRDRAQWICVLPIAWAVAHIGVYAARLPVTFQHGRYLIPIIPVFLLYGLQGSKSLIDKLGHSRVLRRAAIGSLIGVSAAFWVVGAGAYRVDVNIIESELVASARWIDVNAPPDALIAAHDIGAIGYFARRPLLDLAGLISPEVIPIIRDETRLLHLIRTRNSSFFAAPPDFYSALLDASDLEQVFVGTSPFVERHWKVFRVVPLSP